MPPASVETLHLSHQPDQPIYAALFKNVANAPFIRQQLLNGNAEFEYAFIDASSVLSVRHLLSAIFRALNDLQSGRLKSRNIHSEIVFCLSPNNNIAESFRRFGVTDTTTSLLAIKVPIESTLTAEDVSGHLTASVEGQSVAFSDASLADCSDVAKIRKLYKATDDIAGSTGKKGKRKHNDEAMANGTINGDAAGNDAIADRVELESIVISTMTLRGA